jgi:hypothetical protein
MKVRCITDKHWYFERVTMGEVYDVIEELDIYYYIIDNLGDSTICDKKVFEVLEGEDYREWACKMFCEQVCDWHDRLTKLEEENRYGGIEKMIDENKKVIYQFESEEIKFCCQCGLGQFGDENNPGFCEKLDRYLSYGEFYESKPNDCPLKIVEKMISKKKLIEWLDEVLADARDSGQVDEAWAYVRVQEAIRAGDFEVKAK